MSGTAAFAIEVRNRLLTPAEAEVWISVRAADAAGEFAVRGRLLGPRCAYASTVEVAYPLRPLSRAPDALGATARVLIPEPSFWDPESPFLYEGPVTVWEQERLCFEGPIRHGLRHCQLGARGLRWNGRPLALRGVSRQELSAEDALALRRAGYNTLLAPVQADAIALWEAADRHGFLVLGRLTNDADAVRLALALKAHPSCLGWLLSEELLEGPALRSSELMQLHTTHGHLLGTELSVAPLEPLLHGLQFLACPEGLLPDLEPLHWPKIILSGDDASAGEGPDVLGQIHLGLN
jgi:hypothetical protein